MVLLVFIRLTLPLPDKAVPYIRRMTRLVYTMKVKVKFNNLFPIPPPDSSAEAVSEDSEAVTRMAVAHYGLFCMNGISDSAPFMEVSTSCIVLTIHCQGFRMIYIRYVRSG